MKIGRLNKRKGVGYLTASIALALVVVGLLVLYYIVYQTKQLDIHTTVKEAGVERHVLNLGQALLSYDKLVYIENVEENDYAIIHRSVFVKEKIDDQFKEDGDLATEFGYPDSFIALYLKDLETGEEWTFSFTGPFSLHGSQLIKDATCIASTLEVDLLTLLQPPLGPAGDLWTYIQIYNCLQTYASDYGSAIRTFPVAIRYEDASGVSVNQGILKVAIDEWW